MTSIDELRTPDFEALLKSFWGFRSGKQTKGDVKHIYGQEGVLTKVSQ
uniref:Uncharacterized protein n=1 Tax=Chenopodium quinoa TaxID=63459 RepID=A0A803L3T6_CHEQI